MSSFLYLFQKEVSQGSRNAVWPRAPSPCDCPPMRVSAAYLSSSLPGLSGLACHGWAFSSFSKQYPRGSAEPYQTGWALQGQPLSLMTFVAKQMRGGWACLTGCHTLRGPVVKKQNRKSHKKVCIKTYFCTTWGLFLHVSNKTS